MKRDRGAWPKAAICGERPTIATTWSSRPALWRVRRKVGRLSHPADLGVDRGRVVVLPPGLLLLAAPVVVDGDRRHPGRAPRPRAGSWSAPQYVPTSSRGSAGRRPGLGRGVVQRKSLTERHEPLRGLEGGQDLRLGCRGRGVLHGGPPSGANGSRTSACAGPRVRACEHPHGAPHPRRVGRGCGAVGPGPRNCRSGQAWAGTVSLGSARSSSTGRSSPEWVAEEASGPWPGALAARTYAPSAGTAST